MDHVCTSVLTAPQRALVASCRAPPVDGAWRSCFWWADAYAVPTARLATFADAAAAFDAHRVVHEIAVPTILEVLAALDGQSASARFLSCAGWCCGSIPLASLPTARRQEELDALDCGHRLPLQHADVRMDVEEVIARYRV